MSDEPSEIATVVAIIVSVAPEAKDEVTTIDHSSDVFEDLGLDSMDHLAVMTEIAEQTGIEIPEREYSRLRSVASIAERITV